jgi:O-antigen/teichoic acid export membrane protein
MSLVQVAVVVISWGNKDYLMKEFSFNPSQISEVWKENIFTRLLLVFAVSIFFGFLFPSDISLFLISWVFINFVCKSYDVFIYYYKSFLFSLLVEFFSLVVLILFILINKDQLSMFYLLISYIVSGIFRALLLVVYFKMDYKLLFKWKFNLNTLTYSSSFFVLALVGILNAKVDIFCINYAMNKSDLGEYQVLFSFIMLIQGLGYLLVEPFAKNLYRLNEASFIKVKKFLFWVGPVLTLILIMGSYFVITYLFHIPFDIQNYFAGFFYCIPVFVYGVLVYKFFKINRQVWVVYVSLICLFINVVLDLYTIPYLGVFGVMVSGALVQWLKLLFFLLVDYLFSFKLKQQKSISA